MFFLSQWRWRTASASSAQGDAKTVAAHSPSTDREDTFGAAASARCNAIGPAATSSDLLAFDFTVKLFGVADGAVLRPAVLRHHGIGGSDDERRSAMVAMRLQDVARSIHGPGLDS